MLRGIRFYGRLASLTLLTTLAACGDDDADSASIDISANATESSLLEGPGGVKLAIPAGASDTDMTIVVSAAPRTRRASAAGEIVATPIEIEPDGAKFNAQLELSIPIRPADLPAGKTIDDVVVVSAPHGSDAYVPLPTRREGNAVVATTDHFSDFAVVFPPSPIEPPEVACPIATTYWSSAIATSPVRSLLIHAPHVLAAADGPGSRIPIFDLSIATGVNSGVVHDADRPVSMNSTMYQRLQLARVGGVPTVFVSYLRRQYFDGSSTVEDSGGIARLGPIDALLGIAPLAANVTNSIDGVFADVGGPRVLHWPLLSAPVATLSRFASADALDAGTQVPTAPTTASERATPIYAGSRLVGLVRGNEDDPMGRDQHWKVWPIGPQGVLAAVDGPTTITSLTAHDTIPAVYTLSSSGLVEAYTIDESFRLSVRTLAQLPSEYTVPGSSAKIVYSNGSLFFPALVGSLPAILRIQVATGAMSRWIETDTTVFGWSSIAADDGVVCYGASTNAVKCACIDTGFTPFP